MIEATAPRRSLVPAPVRPAWTALLAEPFTPARAAGVGLGRAALDRLVRDGEVVRLLRGVYVGSGVVVTTEVRARALGLAIGTRHTVVGRTAAWLHGAPPASVLVGFDPGRGIPIELRSPGDRLPSSAVVDVAGVRCASAVHVALDLIRRAPPEAAVAALDGLLRCQALAPADLVGAAALAGPEHAPARELVARSDGRARGPAESVLRLRWLDARLPTPCPGLVVAGLRTSLALPMHRFAVVVTDRVPVAARERWQERGWQICPLAADRVLASEASLVRAHLEREFHQHLLAQTGARSTLDAGG